MAVTSVETIAGKNVGHGFYQPPLFKVNLDSGRKPYFIVQKPVYPFTSANFGNVLGSWNGSYYNVAEVHGGKNQGIDRSFKVSFGLQYPYMMCRFYGYWDASSTAHGARGEYSLDAIKNGTTTSHKVIGRDTWIDIVTNSTFWDYLDPDFCDTIQCRSVAWGTGSSWWAYDHVCCQYARRIVTLDDIGSIIYKL